jgi:hypothetical protein
MVSYLQFSSFTYSTTLYHLLKFSPVELDTMGRLRVINVGGHCEKLAWPTLTHYCSIGLYVLSKTIKRFSEGGESSARDSNRD